MMNFGLNLAFNSSNFETLFCKKHELPEFSNIENSGFFMSSNDIYDGLRTVSRYARKACGKGFLGATLFFV